MVINEVAWMGSDNGGTSSANSNDEWMELRNIGTESVALSGWVLKSIDDKPSIVLEGSIEPQGYFLLERTDDSSVQNITADLIYVGALGNTGETLVLIDNNGVEIDRVVGGEDWSSIGGDNTTKYTSQKTDSGWVTAPPTPGNVNAGTSFGGEETNTSENTPEESSTSESASQSQPTGGSSFPVEPQIFAYTGDDRVVTVGADTVFDGQSFGLKNEPLENARYSWNFGNGETKEGQSVLHHYTYPGEYVVILNVSSGKYSASDRAIIEALPADIVISDVTPQFIELSNDGSRELDLSFWRLRGGNEYFTLPKNTFVLSHKKLILDVSVTGLDTHDVSGVALLYPNGVIAYEYNEEQIEALATENQVEQNIVIEKAVSEPIKEQTIAPTEYFDETKEATDGLEEESVDQVATVIESADTNSQRTYKWLLALFALIVLSVVSVIFIKKDSKDTITIID